MRRRVAPLIVLILGSALWHNVSAAADDSIYELRVYTCEPGKLDALHARFRDHTMAFFTKHGMENVAYWVPTDEPLNKNTLIYLLRHKSHDEAKASWAAFRSDPEWRAVAKASADKHGKILSKAPESTYLAAVDYSPEVRRVNRDSLYELRTYTASEGNLENLHARFRDHTDRLLQKHGMKPYAYWRPLDEPLADNTMIYIIEHPNRELARAAWELFGADPEWQEARKKSEEKGSLVVENGIDSLFLQPTDYSPAK
jgi:hypothetical protein